MGLQIKNLISNARKRYDKSRPGYVPPKRKSTQKSGLKTKDCTQRFNQKNDAVLNNDAAENHNMDNDSVSTISDMLLEREMENGLNDF